VVVTVGETVKDPFGDTIPTPRSMLAVVAFVVVHERVADCPWLIDRVSLVNVSMTGSSFTTTVTLAVTDPLSFVASIV